MSAVADPRMPEPAGPADTDAAPPAVIAERPPVMYEASGSIVTVVMVEFARCEQEQPGAVEFLL
jgi:hypothetical protein